MDPNACPLLSGGIPAQNTFLPLVMAGGSGAVGAGVLPPSFNLDALMGAFTTVGTNLGVFAQDQDPIIVPQAAYNSAYGTTDMPTDAYVRIQDTSINFTPITMTSPVTYNLPLSLDMQPKAIQELFELNYGRMNATLGTEIPRTNFNNQTTIPLGYVEPATEIITDSMVAMGPVLGDGTQVWKITHNGVDTHAIHVHLFNVQLINRVGWDGAVRPPDPNELGWKETVRMNPLEDAIVALRPVAPMLPWGVPTSNRSPDVTQPVSSTIATFDLSNGNPITVLNSKTSFGWEYVWHCHLLGHEENDMMRPMVFNVATGAPAAPSGLAANNVAAGNVDLTWTDPTPVTTNLQSYFTGAGNWGNPQNEYQFLVTRTETSPGSSVVTFNVLANQTSFKDTTAASGSTYTYDVQAVGASGPSAAASVAGVAIP